MFVFFLNSDTCNLVVLKTIVQFLPNDLQNEV